MTAPDPALVERVARAIETLLIEDDGDSRWSDKMLMRLAIRDSADGTDGRKRIAESAISETLSALRESGRLVKWRPIDDDTPLSADVLLAIKEPVGWTIECGWAGGKNTCASASGYSNGWRHGRASHWSPRPAPPATAATEGDDR